MRIPLTLIALLALTAQPAPPPIIDVHLHALPIDKRIMYGSDQTLWPETIALSIDAIESADFLSAAQKRDIFYNNAVRFFRLPPRQ